MSKLMTEQQRISMGKAMVELANVMQALNEWEKRADKHCAREVKRFAVKLNDYSVSFSGKQCKEFLEENAYIESVGEKKKK